MCYHKDIHWGDRVEDPHHVDDASGWIGNKAAAMCIVGKLFTVVANRGLCAFNK